MRHIQHEAYLRKKSAFMRAFFVFAKNLDNIFTNRYNQSWQTLSQDQ